MAAVVAHNRNLALVHSRTIPLTRADCVDGPRPCPYIRCKWSLGAEAPCVLDRADQGPLEQSEVGRILGLSRQRIDQIEREALAKLGGNAKSRRALKELVEP